MSNQTEHSKQLGHKPEEELIDELQVRPGGLQGRLVLLGIKLRAIGAVGGRQGAEQVDGEHLHDL